MDNTISNEDITLLFKYPMIKKTLHTDCVKYEGVIDVNDNVYRIFVVESNSKCILKLPTELQHLKDDFNEILLNSHLKGITMYLDTLKILIENSIPSRVPPNHCDIFTQVLFEYTEFTRFYINLKSCYLHHDLSKIRIIMLDEQNREHSVVIEVNYDGLEIFKISEYDLPQEKEKFKASSNLRVVYDSFVEIINELQPYFDVMEQFDKHSHVLDPIECKRRHNYRRIWLDDNLSMIITINPFRVTQIPEIRFLGPDKQTEQFYAKMNHNIESWQSGEEAVYIQVLKLIDLDVFPQRSKITQQEDVLVGVDECCICFSLHLKDKLPDVVCKNLQCGNCYHVECLYEWLISLNARRAFSTIVGQCLNCEKNIYCPIPS